MPAHQPMLCKEQAHDQGLPPIEGWVLPDPPSPAVRERRLSPSRRLTYNPWVSDARPAGEGPSRRPVGDGASSEARPSSPLFFRRPSP